MYDTYTYQYIGNRVFIRCCPVQRSTMVKQQMGLLRNRDEEFGDGDEGETKRTFQEGPAAKPPAHFCSTKPRTGALDVGQYVTISGLKGAAQYNGAVGEAGTSNFTNHKFTLLSTVE